MCLRLSVEENTVSITRLDNNGKTVFASFGPDSDDLEGTAEDIREFAGKPTLPFSGILALFSLP